MQPPVNRLRSWMTFAGPFMGLVLVIIIFSVLTWWKGTLNDFLSISNFKLILTHSTTIAAAGLGMTIIMITGGIDLSVGYVISFVTVVMMLIYRQVMEWYPGETGLAGMAALSAGLATGSTIGLCNGLFITRLKVVPFVATLAMLGLARGMGIFLTEGSPLNYPTDDEPPVWMKAINAIDPASVSPEWAWLKVSPAVWSVLILAVIVAMVLRYTVLGRHCFAIGSNEATARLCGIRVERTKLILYSLAGLLIGWAGVIQFCRTNAGSHDVAAGMELSVIAAVVIGGGSLMGGEGTVLGTVLGAIIMTILEDGCSKLDLKTDVRYIVIAGIILSVAALNSWRQRRE